MMPYSTEEIRSRLGISTSALADKLLDPSSLEEIRRAGIQYLEIMENPMNQFQEEDPKTMKGIVLACKDLGLSIRSFHTLSIDFARGGENQRHKEVERSKRIIDHLISIGGNVWVTHIPITEEKAKKSYGELAKYYEGQDICLVVENNMSASQSIQACIEWIDSISHSQIGLLLDVGHERNAQNQNPMTISGQAVGTIQAIGQRLRHIHLHDFIDGLDHYPPFEKAGELQWCEVFSALKDIDYQGVFVFEPRKEGDRSSNPVGKVGQFPETIAKVIL